MAVRIRLKKMGRRHRPFYRICAMDSRSPRGGKVLEELGTYDPMVRDTDARARLKADRINYWLGVGAQPSDKVAVLIKKYGENGTHLEQQQAALEKLSGPRVALDPSKLAAAPKKEEPEPEQAAAEGDAAASDAADAPAEEAATEETATEEAASEEAAEAAGEENGEGEQAAEAASEEEAKS